MRRGWQGKRKKAKRATTSRSPRPRRGVLPETGRAFHRVRGRRGQFWEWRYRAWLIEDDTYGLAALHSLDLNPVRAGLVADPAASPWSSCAAYADGTPNPLITVDPSYVALGSSPESRQVEGVRYLSTRGGDDADIRG